MKYPYNWLDDWMPVTSWVAQLADMLLAYAGECHRGSPGQVELITMILAAGVPLMQGLLGTLLGPSPLARLHKVTSVLVNLATAPGLPIVSLCQNLYVALENLPPDEVDAGTAAMLHADVSATLHAIANEGSPLGHQDEACQSSHERTLKRTLRTFAEMHQHRL